MQIFVRGHFLEFSVPRCGNCELRGTDNIQGQISVHIFAQNRRYCVFYPSNILQRTWKMLMNSLLIEHSMKTSASFKENTAFSSAVMTRLTWRYRDRELITASSFKLVKAGNMSWILGLDSKSLKQNHSWSSLSILNNRNSIHVYFG